MHKSKVCKEEHFFPHESLKTYSARLLMIFQLSKKMHLVINGLNGTLLLIFEVCKMQKTSEQVFLFLCVFS